MAWLNPSPPPLLPIREAQLDAFTEAAIDGWITGALPVLRESFANHFTVYGDEAVRALVRLALRKGEAHGFVDGREAYQLAVLMLMFGSHFDRDPWLPWARPLLDAHSIAALVECGIDEFEALAGEDRRHVNRALVVIARELPQLVARPVASDVDAIAELLGELWPTRAAAIGERELVRLVECSYVTARAWGWPGDRGAIAHAIAVVMLGAGFDEDPLHAWVSPARGSVGAFVDAAQNLARKWIARTHVPG